MNSIRTAIKKLDKLYSQLPQKTFEFKEKHDKFWSAITNNPRYTAFTHSSSFVGNVLYDRDTSGMSMILNGTTYDFCNVPERIYDAFEGANSKGAFFNRIIKTQFDC